MEQKLLLHTLRNTSLQPLLYFGGFGLRVVLGYFELHTILLFLTRRRRCWTPRRRTAALVVASVVSLDSWNRRGCVGSPSGWRDDAGGVQQVRKRSCDWDKMVIVTSHFISLGLRHGGRRQSSSCSAQRSGRLRVL